MKILLAGGGSGGPVTPLIAVAEQIKIKHPRAEFLLVGTKYGPEAGMANSAGIDFEHITTGKLRRYFSLKNLLSPFLIFNGFLQARKIIRNYRPSIVFGTGSFVQVPIVWAAWLLKIPVVLHQQDVVPSLANKLCQWFSKKITVSFELSLSSFSTTLGFFYRKKAQEKIILTGNPFRQGLREGTREKAIKIFSLKRDMPTLLVLGGGTGAKFLNDLMVECSPKLTKMMQVIHSTGKHKNPKLNIENYHAFEFIKDMAEAYAIADIVVARAGLSTITELSNLRKVAIIVPMPKTHQELNALYLIEKEAAIVLNQDRVKTNNFLILLKKLLFAGEAQKVLKGNISKIMPHNAAEKIAELIIKTIETT